MRILVLGGTRFFGVHLVRRLLSGGHDVTIATRGQAKDPFGGTVQRLALDRTDPESVKRALFGLSFDAVYDNIAYASSDVIDVLSHVKAGRYILTSSASVYTDLALSVPEAAFDPLSHPLKVGSRNDFDYGEGKRQAECALFQGYGEIPSVCVRFPYITGTDDYTGRFAFYVRHTLSQTPMYIDNPNAETAFIDSASAGACLAALLHSNATGPLNLQSDGTLTPAALANAVTSRTGIAWINDPDGDPAPYNGAPSFSLDTSRATRLGLPLTPIDAWLDPLIDALIREGTPGALPLDPA